MAGVQTYTRSASGVVISAGPGEVTYVGVAWVDRSTAQSAVITLYDGGDNTGTQILHSINVGQVNARRGDVWAIPLTFPIPFSSGLYVEIEYSSGTEGAECTVQVR